MKNQLKKIKRKDVGYVWKYVLATKTARQRKTH